MSSRIKELAERGQSVWYDFITRDLVTGGELERLIEEDGLRGRPRTPRSSRRRYQAATSTTPTSGA